MSVKPLIYTKWTIDGFQFSIEEEDTGNRYNATLSFDLLENHPLLSKLSTLDLILECYATDGDCPGSNCEIIKEELGWIIQISLTEVNDSRVIVHDEITIECLGPVIETDIERLERKIESIRATTDRCFAMVKIAYDRAIEPPVVGNSGSYLEKRLDKISKDVALYRRRLDAYISEKEALGELEKEDSEATKKPECPGSLYRGYW